MVLHYRLLRLRSYLFVPFLDIDNCCKFQKYEAGSKWGSCWSSHGARWALSPSLVTRAEASVALHGRFCAWPPESDLWHVTTGHGLQASQGVTWDSLQSGHALVEGREAAGRVAESPGIVDSRGKTPELFLPGCFGYKACRWTLVAFLSSSLPAYPDDETSWFKPASTGGLSTAWLQCHLCPFLADDFLAAYPL